MITIGFFGQLSELIAREIELELPSAVRTVGELRGHLASRYPEAEHTLNGERMKYVIGEKFVRGEEPLADVLRVDFLPPVSGG